MTTIVVIDHKLSHRFNTRRKSEYNVIEKNLGFSIECDLH